MHTISVLVTIDIPAARSLKDKRSVVRSLVERLRQRLHVAAAETGMQDVVRAGEIGFAVVSGDYATALHLADEACRFIDTELIGRAEVRSALRDATSFEAEKR